MEGLTSTSKLIISLETHDDGSLMDATEGLVIGEKLNGDDPTKVLKHASQVSTDNILLETCSTQTLDGGADEVGMFEDSSISTQSTGLTNSAASTFPVTTSKTSVREKYDRDRRAYAKNRSKSESLAGNAVIHDKKKKKPIKLSHSTRLDSNISIDGGASEHGLYDDSSIESEVLLPTMKVKASKNETLLASLKGESVLSETVQPPEAPSSSRALSRCGSSSTCESTDSTKRAANTEINPDEIDEREWLSANEGTTGPIDRPLEPPHAPLVLKTESTLSIDGGANERGLYDDSSISTQATELLVSQYDDNDYLVEREKRGNVHATTTSSQENLKQSALHSHHCAMDEEVNAFTFSPDIAETQHTKHTPLNPCVHGQENMSVFQRLYGDSKRWQEHKQHIREDIQHTEEEELTFSPKTNIVHKSEQTSPTPDPAHRIIYYEKPHKVKADPSKEGKSMSHTQDTIDL